jgi:hypothetical protein
MPPGAIRNASTPDQSVIFMVMRVFLPVGASPFQRQRLKHRAEVGLRKAPT